MKVTSSLGYVSSAGSQAFEDLSDVVERLGDTGKGMMGWTKDIQSRLRLGKRYLKRDYKANVLHIHSITLSNTLTVLKAEDTFDTKVLLCRISSCTRVNENTLLRERQASI